MRRLNLKFSRLRDSFQKYHCFNLVWECWDESWLLIPWAVWQDRNKFCVLEMGQGPMSQTGMNTETNLVRQWKNVTYIPPHGIASYTFTNCFLQLRFHQKWNWRPHLRSKRRLTWQIPRALLMSLSLFDAIATCAAFTQRALASANNLKIFSLSPLWRHF